MRNEGQSPRPLAWQWWWICFLLVCWGFLLLAFWPGQLSADSLGYIFEARTGKYQDWHPPLMVWLVGTLDQERFGARIPTVLMITAWALSWWLLSCRVSTKRRYAWITTLLIVLAVWPPYWGLLGALWKDVWMAVLLLLAVVVAFVFQHWPRWALVSIFVGCLFVAALRYNALFATLPLLIGVGSALLRPPLVSLRWRLVSLTLLVITHLGGVWIVNAGVHHFLTVTKRYIEQALFLYDLSGVSVTIGHNLLPLPPNSEIPVSVLRQVYSTDGVTIMAAHPQGLKWVYRKEEVEALRAAWLNAIEHYPVPYLQHRARVFARQFALSGPRVCSPFVATAAISSYSWARDRTELVYQPGWSGQVAWSALTWVIPLFSGWVYLVLCVAISMYTLVLMWLQKPHVPCFAAAVSGSGMCYGLSYFFLSPACDYRLHYWTALAGGLALVLVLIEESDGWRSSTGGKDEF